MNILSISGILPVPGIVKANDFLIPLFETYRRKYPDDNIYFIKPFAYKPTLKSSRSLFRLKKYSLHGFNVVLLPYLSTWKRASLHSIISSLSSYFLNRRTIRRLLKEWDIDIVHAEYIFPDGYLARMIGKHFGIKYIVTVHDENRYMDYLISRTRAIKILSNASWITPLNYPSARLYKKYVNTKIEVIPHGIDTRFLDIYPEYSARPEIRIITIAQLLAYKNIDKVLIALTQVKNDYKIKYTIIGRGPEREKLENLVMQHGLQDIVIFKEQISYDQVPVEICKNDIFILPSYFETFGRVLFEAMAVGLPVICAKDSGIHGYFSEGVEALSVLHDNTNDIAEKLTLLLKDVRVRKEMGNKAKELMRKHTWENIVADLHEIYLESIKNT